MARPKGSTKEKQAAKRNLEAMIDLKEKVNVSVILEALDAVLETMRDPNAGAATKRLCANDILALYFRLNKDSLEVMAETKEKQKGGEEESEEEESPSQEKSSGSLIRLDFKQK